MREFELEDMSDEIILRMQLKERKSSIRTEDKRPG